ncbi:hypothetical protein [Isachenkonia alkalipeptolytica]|uniref:Uncharacterized protein n=1 Tax=Isachenkonia alkalipeptolytica TaxID=2565777 RepID=A0AA44BCJ0_9CLOT|nr:hypothetical protein [Isachenkonia alkalipeptolytica]NBG86968.1 hypothetical protein [Isachenkonia alkalipeptolytica]
MVVVIGWVNIALIVIMGSIYPIKQVYLKKFKEQGKEKAQNWGRLYQFARKAHPATGLIILAIGFYHGYQAFSLTVWHTGTLLLYTLLLMAVVALAGPRIKAFKKHWRKVHRSLGGVVYVLAILHIFWRNLL